MENRKTFKVIIISIVTYIVLSWIIVAGNFNSDGFNSTGINQVGLFDILLAPINLFNYFVITVSKSVSGYVEQVGYGNIVIAFICIGIYYGVLNSTDAYYKLVMDLKKKLIKKRDKFLIVVAFIYCLVSALSGLNLVLFLFFPFVCTLLYKLKFSRLTTFTSTIGAMLIGQLGSLYNPSINGINRILFQIGINDNIISRIIYFIILVIILLGSLFLSNKKHVKKEQKSLLFEDKSDIKNIKSSYAPIVVVTSISTIILVICMYNWYYMFDIAGISNAYDKINSFGIKEYNFMKNIFGMSEHFGYWTGFTMSAFLLVDSLVIKFLYRLKLENLFANTKKAILQLSPMIFYSVISLSIIVISLKNSDSFLYCIIDKLFKIDNQVFGILLSGILHNFFINDYFALTSSLSEPIVSVYGYDNLSNSLLITQIAHGISSLVSPLNVFLIAGLTYLKIPYTKWIKYIYKVLLLIVALSIIILLITKMV